MTKLKDIRKGIGATRRLDHGAAIDPLSGAQLIDEPTEADAIAAVADVHDSFEAGPSKADECGAWGDQEIGAMIRMYRSGKAMDDIAEEIGESLESVRTELRAVHADMIYRAKHGVSPGRPVTTKRLTPEQHQQILTMRDVQHMKVVEIARSLGITEGSVRYVISTYGCDHRA